MTKLRRKSLMESLKCEYYRMEKSYLVCVPIILLFIGIFTRWVSGSPIATIHYIGIKAILPPTWIMILLFSVFYIVAGLSLGVSLGNKFCSFGERKYQGAMWFCICLALGYVWYPIFFCSRLLFISLLVDLLCLFAGVCATICFFSVSKLSFCLAIVYNAWLLYLTLLNMQIFFTV